MNKQIIIGTLILSMLLLLSNLTLAETTEIEDTIIDYVSYREVVVDDPGVIYQIKITNMGTRTREYEIVPDTEVIRNLGTYRIDPSDKIELEQGKQKTFYLYLAVEKPITERTVIPVEVRSGLADIKLELVARPIGPLPKEQYQARDIVVTVFKVILIIILIIIIILALVFSFRKKKKEDEGQEPDFDEDIGTYY